MLAGFAVFYFLDCLVLWLCDPHVPSYGDALWLGFNIFTSIGLGDYTVTTLAARIAAVLLGVYGAVIAAYLPGLCASAYFDQISRKQKAAFQNHQQELSNVAKMSHEEKAKLAQTISKENRA